VKTLITRTITGVFFVIAIIGSVIWNPFAFGILFLGFMILGLIEFYRLPHSTGLRPQIFTGVLSSASLYILSMLTANQIIPVWSLVFVLPLFPIFLLIALFRKNDQPLLSALYSIAGVVYVAIPFSLLNFFMNPSLSGKGHHYQLLLGFFFLVWINDIFAYLSGMVFGKHKLFERISPKKTIEGSIGGLLFSVVLAWLMSQFFTEIGSLNWMAMAVIIVIFGIFGDLSESMIKRQFEVKDSGTLLPGHGGILDRFDAMFFSAPAVFCYLLILYL
jgi:phosphatidate cytidylyltransferase